jgi:hypothetical protein
MPALVTARLMPELRIAGRENSSVISQWTDLVDE